MPAAIDSLGIDEARSMASRQSIWQIGLALFLGMWLTDLVFSLVTGRFTMMRFLEMTVVYGGFTGGMTMWRLHRHKKKAHQPERNGN